MLQSATLNSGDKITLVAPTMAMSLVPAHKPLQARSKATSPDEQAVSIVMLGPLRLNIQLRRFDRIAALEPLAKYFGIRSGSRRLNVMKSEAKNPTWTEVLLPAMDALV